MQDIARAVEPQAEQQAPASRGKPDYERPAQLPAYEEVKTCGGKHKERERLQVVRDLQLEAPVYKLVYDVRLVLHAVHERGAVYGRCHVVGKPGGVGADEHDGVP